MDHVGELPPRGGAALLLASGAYGTLRAEDAEQLQVWAGVTRNPSALPDTVSSRFAGHARPFLTPDPNLESS